MAQVSDDDSIDLAEDFAERLDDNRVMLYYSSLVFRFDLPDNPNDITDKMVVETAQELMQILNDLRTEQRNQEQEDLLAARAEAGKHTHFYYDDTQSGAKERECICSIGRDHSDPNPYEVANADG